jgi:hypothetical protein
MTIVVSEALKIREQMGLSFMADRNMEWGRDLPLTAANKPCVECLPSLCLLSFLGDI